MTENQIRAKKYLRRVSMLPSEIESKLLEIEAMRTRAEGLSAIRYDKDTVQTSPAEHMSEAVIVMLEFIDSLSQTHKELVELRQRADEIMRKLKSEQRLMLDYYFFKNKNFRQISRELPYSERTVKRRYYEGLEIFGEQLLAAGNK